MGTRHFLVAVLAVAMLSSCSSNRDTDSKADSTPPPPCTNAACRAYDAGFARGEEALTTGEEFEAPARLRDQPPADSAASAVQHDRQVVEYGCHQLARDTDYLGEERDAYEMGCVDGGTPMLSGHPNRHDYEGF
ncbi:hypothetical protein [Streptomyces sp. NRRL F-5630]|uniref:hypothetical protein n=1 Tax=Streptomyces sp. NRRL F-5630 TaxID=1463864 RepID=UPI0004C9A7D3|nr:hypothetical protein [Streptomyces sp. NRRL F-5630]